MWQFIMITILVVGLTALIMDLLKAGKPKTAEVIIEDDNNNSNRFERIKIWKK